MIEDQGLIRQPRLRVWDLWLLWGALVFIVILAWAYLLLLAREMSAHDMSGDMCGMLDWVFKDYLMMFVMWAVMMVGMMVPTCIRSVTIYSRIANQAQGSCNAVAATYWFVLGYVIVWTGFSVVATLLQAMFNKLGMLSPMMVNSSSYLGAGLLIAAGLYQLTPWKDTCLVHCQSPAMYLAGRFGPRVLDGVGLGIRHGAYCLGCCWLLMALLFVGGVMNLLWIAAITAFVFMEKLLQTSIKVTRVSAVLMIVSGAVYFIGA